MVGVVARVADEAPGLGQRRRAEEGLVDFEHRAVGDAGAAHDAVHHFAQRAHRLVRDDVLALRHGAGGLQPGLDGADLVPERRHVDDEVLDHRQVAGRLDRDLAVASSTMLSTDVLQARRARPLMRMAQEPQMALRQEQRSDSVPSWYSRTSISESSTVALSGMSTV